MVCQHTGARTWQILKNETHVYFISVTEIEYTWVFFYGSGADEYAKEKKNAVIYESAFYPVYCGDKTQLMLVAMTSRFKLKDILLGTGVAILVLNGLAVLAGGIISTVVPTWLIRLIAGAAFLFFAVTTLKGDDDEEENVKDRKIKFAPLSVFCTFFVAELGDKTQLTAITFGANEGLSSAVVVWLACSLGLFAADVIGLLIGYLLKSKAPEGILNTVAFVIFSIFGILTLRQGFGLLLGAGSSMILPLTLAVTVVFVIVCLVLYKQAKKN